MPSDPVQAAFRDHAIPFETGQAAPDDFSDLEALRPVLDARRVVLLGEHSHGDGAAFTVKSRLARFLHRELGFDVIAFEAGIFDCHAADRAMRLSPSDPAARAAFVRDALPDIWSRCAQLAPLIEEIARPRDSRPLDLVGFDCQLGALAQQRIADDLGDFLVGSGTCTPAEWGAVRSVVSALASRGSSSAPYPDGAAQASFLTLLRAARHTLGQPLDRDTRLWSRIIASTTAHAENLWAQEHGTASGRAAYATRREIELGRNLCWWAGEQYPKRRIVVWAHQGHLLRNVGDVSEWNDWHHTAPTAGEVVWNTFRGEVYTIAFAACRGHFGRVGQPKPSPIRAPSEGTLEGAMLSTSYDAALVDFTTVPERLTALRRCACRLKGYREVVIEPARHLDGLIVLREMEPARSA